MHGLLEESTTQIKTERYIGSLKGNREGPSLIFFGGIHGNEPAGVQALEQAFAELGNAEKGIRGSIYAIRGNVPALLRQRRFLDADLNRLWSSKQISAIEEKDRSALNTEERELLEIKHTLDIILQSESGPFYFIDFHTTSSRTLPFITINDALINRKFSRMFPVPIILGIEEYLDGPLLSRMNELGYVSLGFESGQHLEAEAVQNNIAFFWLALVFTGILDKKQVPHFDRWYDQLKVSASGNRSFYEVVYRHKLLPSDAFSMRDGFESFQSVSRGTVLAIQNKEKVTAEQDTILFMPLYQKQGAEGYFLIDKTPKWALWLSAWLRQLKSDRVLTYLPGISWGNDKKQSLLVDLSVARFFTKSFFHLLGYRNRQLGERHLRMHNRERAARNGMYRNEPWY